jgi:tRNA G10  N-methylase Trm11
MGEDALCQMEMRAFFGFDTKSAILESSLRINPSRSPFIKERLDVIYTGDRWEDIAEQVRSIEVPESSFKVIFVKNNELDKVGFQERRKIEREIGIEIPGEVDLIKPEFLFGIMKVKDGWAFGKYTKNEAIWFQHQKKPQMYSTALGTRVARSIVNIAAPNPDNIKVIDPCCGIGTVLVEALSMGIDIVGSDLNRIVVYGAQENIAYFGLEGEVSCKDVRDIVGSYDVAIIDMPYNLCSVITPQEQLEMLQSARMFAKKLVIITIEPIDSFIKEAGFEIIDRCVAQKSLFMRQVIVCE